MAANLIIEYPNGVRTWLNPHQILKMEQAPDGRYFVKLTNGEVLEIDRRLASKIEEALEYND